MFAPNKWLCNWWDWRCFQSHAHHHRTCQHVNMSSKCHALCQAVLVPNNVRPQQNVQVSHLLMNLTWQSIRQQVLCNDNDMTWQSISAAVQWQWHDMTIYQTWQWQLKVLQWMRLALLPTWPATFNHEKDMHAMNAVHENEMYCHECHESAHNLFACHECGPWTWHVCHECHKFAHNMLFMPWMRSMNMTCMPWMPWICTQFFLSHRLLSSCFSPLMLSFCMHHATISSPSTVLCHARIQVTHMAVAAVVNGKVGTAWVNHMDNTSKPGIS